MTDQLDPITLEIVANGLLSVADESFAALMKSAYSTNIKERRDHSTAIVDPAGRLIVQAAGSLPIHIASMMGLMEHLFEKFGDDIHDDDIFIANDPHVAGGTHLPDINMATPIFHDGRLIGFMCNIAHHADMGGMVPGSMAGGMSEIYQEGLRVPVIRLFSKGELQRDILDLLLLNVRVMEERRGDYYAQIAACRLGARRVLELADQYGADLLLGVFDDIVARTAKRMRTAIKALPDGDYVFDDVMDDDGLGTVDIPIKLKVTIKGSRIRFDFTGTAPQVRGNVNVTWNATQAAVCYAIKALLDPDVPNNHGVVALPDIVAPEGTLLNAVFPAPVAARANTSQRIIDVAIGALAKACPDAAVAAANGANTTAVFSGVNPRTGKQYVYLETLGGGFGGRAAKDGKDGVQVHITNTSNLPVEAIETEYPLLVESYSLVEDSGGAGRFRGGLGLRRVIGPVGHTTSFNGAGERFRNAPWGLFGGKAGGRGRFMHMGNNAKPVRLADKPLDIYVGEGELIAIETPGAGGNGRPGARSKAALDTDRRSGKFSAAFLKRHYGPKSGR